MGPASLAQTRGGHSCPVDAGDLLWWPGPFPTEEPRLHLPLGPHSPFPVAPNRVAGAGAHWCGVALPPGPELAMPGDGA